LKHVTIASCNKVVPLRGEQATICRCLNMSRFYPTRDNPAD
jgi:hypothetical protein